ISPLPSPVPSPSALAFRGLDTPRRGVAAAAAAPADQQEAVARQFEAMFIQMLLKQARKTSEMSPGLLDSPGVRMAQSLGDEQAALNLSNPGLGLAQALLAQMRGGVMSKGLDASTLPPEAAASRVPGLRSRIGEDRRQVADSITALIDLLSRGQVSEKVTGAKIGRA